MLEDLLSKYNNKDKNISLSLCKEEEKQELYEIFLEIIKEGNSYPQVLPFTFEDFLNYFFSKGSRVLICSSHIANAGYIVKKEYITAQQVI